MFSLEEEKCTSPLRVVMHIAQLMDNNSELLLPCSANCGCVTYKLRICHLLGIQYLIKYHLTWEYQGLLLWLSKFSKCVLQFLYLVSSSNYTEASFQLKPHFYCLSFDALLCFLHFTKNHHYLNHCIWRILNNYCLSLGLYCCGKALKMKSNWEWRGLFCLYFR